MWFLSRNEIEEALVILEGNQSTISLCYKQRSKSVFEAYSFYIWHPIGTGLVQVKWIPSEYNTAGCGT
jgi:hypothetical protein